MLGIKREQRQDDGEPEYVDGDETVIELEVAEADLGKVIGRAGRVARALRNVLSAAGSKLDKRYALEIIE